MPRPDSEEVDGGKLVNIPPPQGDGPVQIFLSLIESGLPTLSHRPLWEITVPQVTLQGGCSQPFSRSHTPLRINIWEYYLQYIQH